MGLRRPFRTEEENALLPGNQIAAQQMAEEDQLSFPQEDLAALEQDIQERNSIPVLSNEPKDAPTPPMDDQVTKPTNRADFYDKLLKEYDAQKKQQAAGRTTAVAGDAVSNFLGDLYKIRGGDGLTRSNAAGSFDEQSKGALEELKVRAALMEKNSPEKAKYQALGDQIVKIDNDGTVTPVFQSDYKNQYLNLAKQQKELGEKRLDYTKEKGDRLSDKQVEELTALDKTGDLLTDAENSLPKYEKYLGPYASKIESLKGAIPFSEMDPGFVEAQQVLGIQMAAYVKEMTGAASSDKERAELRDNTPKMTDKPEAFRTKLQNLQKIKDRQKEQALKNMQKQGKNVSTFQKESDSQQKQPSEDLVKQYSSMHNIDESKARQILINRMNR